MRNEPVPTPATAPLAVDAEGRLMNLPEGAAGWRVRRQTGGRPRLMLGVDRQPLRLPLEITLADLEDVLAPAVYRLDLVDPAGNSLGVPVRPIQVGAVANDQREASVEDDEPEEHVAPSITAPLPATSSEVRLVLEANVRAMQASFLHNQRTLELSLRMADTLRDGVRVLADAQSDWIKSLAASKGWLRNASPMPAMLPAAPPPSVEAEEVEDEESEDAPEAAPRHWADKLGEQLVPLAAPMVAQFVQSVMPSKAAPAATGARNGASSGGVIDTLRDVVDWRRAAEKGAEARAKEAAPTAPPNPMSLVASLPPDLVAKLMAVRQQLTADEQQELMRLIGALSPSDVPVVVAELQPMSIEQLTARLRALIGSPAPAE